MKITQSNFNNILKKNFLFEKKPKIAVAVSGGPDSMCLIFLLNKWIQKNNGSLIALVVDHGIRKESILESKIIIKYLLKHNIKSKLLKVNKMNVINKSMNEARNNRFSHILNYCLRYKFFHLFVAHHYDDNLETFLLRKVAGSNFYGLKSMQQKINMEGVLVLRPLLEYKKIEILEYNNNNKIFYVEDPSNKKIKYSRVAIRKFLKNNHIYKNDIIDEFNLIQNYFSPYIKMIFQIFNQLAKNIKKEIISVDVIIFFKHDEEIQIKIIEIIYKFLKPQRVHLRQKKIINFIALIRNKDLIKTNLAGMAINRDFSLITFAS